METHVHEGWKAPWVEPSQPPMGQVGKMGHKEGGPAGESLDT